MNGKRIEADWHADCPSCRGEDGHESGGVAGWISAPCTCHPAWQEIKRLAGDLQAMEEGELAALKEENERLVEACEELLRLFVPSRDKMTSEQQIAFDGARAALAEATELW